MHELIATKEIVRIAEEESARHTVKPSKVVVEVGESTTYKKEPLIYYFDILKKESRALKRSCLVVHMVDGENVIIRELICAKKRA